MFQAHITTFKNVTGKKPVEGADKHPIFTYFQLQHNIQFISLLHNQIAKLDTTVCFVHGNSLKYTCYMRQKIRNFLRRTK